MKIINILLFAVVSVVSTTAMADMLSPEQVIQRVLDHYPSIKTAAIEIERARQSIKVVNSQLSWQLDAQAGVERGVSALGTGNDSLSAAA
ncbi:MAG: hypothetical protein OEM07_06575, partial [Gammaproteobacteria bacterium]|nr:hypothetical protein [Gammaproteobacteria bacterium]